MDRNGYNPSILQTSDVEECFLCGVPYPLQRHEIFGAAYRDKSKREGLWITLCPTCHMDVHSHPLMYRYLKCDAEEIWLDHTGQEMADFKALFGRNYL